MTPDVEVAIAAAEAGAAVIRATYGGPVTRYAKSAADFATETDLEAERAIKATVREAFPDDAFLGEEGGLDGPPDATRTWLVDPLCGTLNFAATTPLVAVNVALRHGNDMVAAAVIDPFAGETYWSDGNVARLRTGAGEQEPAPSGVSRLVDLDFDGNPGWADGRRRLTGLHASVRHPRALDQPGRHLGGERAPGGVPPARRRARQRPLRRADRGVPRRRLRDHRPRRQARRRRRERPDGRGRPADARGAARDPPRGRLAQRSQAVGPSVRGGLDASVKPRPCRYDVRMNPLRTRCGWSPTFWVFTIRAVR